MLFATAGYHRCNPGVLVSCPLASTIKSLELLQKQANKEHRKRTVVRSDSFLLTTSNQQQSIECVMSRAVANKVAENRQKLGSFVEMIVLCGRQNTPCVATMIVQLILRDTLRAHAIMATSWLSGTSELKQVILL